MTTKNIGRKKTNKTVLILLFIVFVTATAFFLWNNRSVSAEITLDFSIFPENHTSGAAFAVYAPDLKLSDIRAISRAAIKHDISLTVFIVAHEDLTSEEALIGDAELKLDPIKKALADARYVFQDAGYVDEPYSSLEYQQQEDLLKLSRKAFREDGRATDGFLPPAFDYTYDTILAAENMKYDYVILPSTNETLPLHPRAAFGGKMNIIIFPYREQVGPGLNIIFLNADADEIIQSVLDQGSIAVKSLEEWSEQTRGVESIGATMVTDVRDLTSQVSFTDIKNGTKMIITSELSLIAVSNGNKTVGFNSENGENTVILSEGMELLNLNWSLDKYK